MNDDEPDDEIDDGDGTDWLTCSECGIEFGVPELWAFSRRQDGRTFYCPNGHTQHFGESPLVLAQRELAASKAERERLEADLEKAKQPSWWRWL